MARYLMNSLYENQNDVLTCIYDDVNLRDSEDKRFDANKPGSTFSKSNRFLGDCPIKVGL